jgi:hypothetical protein
LSSLQWNGHRAAEVRPVDSIVTEKNALARCSSRPAKFTIAIAIPIIAIAIYQYLPVGPRALFPQIQALGVLDRFFLCVLLFWLALLHAISFVSARVGRTRPFKQELTLISIAAFISFATYFLLKDYLSALNSFLSFEYIAELLPPDSFLYDWLYGLLTSSGSAYFQSAAFQSAEIICTYALGAIYFFLYFCSSGLHYFTAKAPREVNRWQSSLVLSRSLSGFALLAFIVVIAQHGYTVANSNDRQWELHAQGSIIWPALTVFIHLSYSLMFRTRARHRTESTPDTQKTTGTEHPARSIKPLFDSMSAVDALNPHVHANWRTITANPADVPTNEYIQTDLQKIVAGQHIRFTGSPSATFYTLLGEAVSANQDKGMLSLIICPDFCGSTVEAAITATGSMKYIEIARKQFLLTMSDDTTRTAFSRREFYDLIIVEEGQLETLLGKSNDSLRLITSRLGFIGLIDFHAIDACKIYKTLNQFGEKAYPDKVGVLCQSLRRVGIETQLIAISQPFGTNQDVEKSALIETPVESGRLIWEASEDLRQSLLEQANLDASRTRYGTAPYLALQNAEQRDYCPSDYPHTLLGSPNTETDIDELRRTLAQDGTIAQGDTNYQNLNALRDNTKYHHAPQTETRVLTIIDQSCLVDALSFSPAFNGDAPDYLVNVVMPGYLGRQFMIDKINSAIDGVSWKSHELDYLSPLAQIPGFGVSDIGAIFLDQLTDDESSGLNDDEANRLLKLAAKGNIEKALDISVSKQGLEKFFALIFREFNSRVSTNFETIHQQGETYRLDGGAGAHQLRNDGSNTKVYLAGALQSDMSSLLVDDNGLLFHTGASIRLSNTYYQITQIIPNSNTISVNKLKRDSLPVTPEPIYRYCRHYNIAIGTDERSKADRFVIEDHGEVLSSNNSKILVLSMHASIERVSNGYFERSSDDEPDPQYLKNTPTLGTGIIKNKREFKHILFLNSDFGIDESADENDSAVYLKTLAATLRAVVALSFPALENRIAVVPIGAHETPDPWWNTASGSPSALLTEFPTASLRHGSVAELHQRLASTETNLPTQPFERSIAIIEDAAYDLGVCRSMYQNRVEILKRWERFVKWAADKESWHIDDELNPSAVYQSTIFRNE